MRVLVIVTAFRNSNRRLADRFLAFVKEALAPVTTGAQVRLDVQHRTHAQLAEFVPLGPLTGTPANTEAVVRCVSALDGVDPTRYIVSVMRSQFVLLVPTSVAGFLQVMANCRLHPLHTDDIG